MYIPTQEERYSKRSLVTLILCVMAPSGVYAYSISDKFSFPVDSAAGMLNLLLFFTYPLAWMFESLGVPALQWSVFNWGGIICSLVVHALLVAYIWKNKALTPKNTATIAVTIGFVDLLALYMINAGYFQS